jgi:gliding motility-associated-like protein
VISGPPEPYNYNWDTAPLNNTGVLPNLVEGNYVLNVLNPNYSDNCALDTSFDIIGARIPMIDTIITTETECYASNGTAEIFMVDETIEYDYSWDGSGYLSRSTANYLSAGNHDVTARDPISGCTADSTFLIPDVPFDIQVSSEDPWCGQNDGVITVIAPSPLLDKYINNTLFSAPTRTSLSPGDYLIRVEAPGIADCFNDTTVTIVNRNTDIFANFTYDGEATDQLFEPGDPIQFTNTSWGLIEGYNWEFSNGETSEERDPTTTFEETEEQTVYLFVEDIYGCTDDTLKRLKITEKPPCEAAIPNAFSPNGDDQNDDIGVLGNPEEMDLKIFNRWGEPIFRARDISDRWDGLFRGEEAPIGAYPFVLDYSCPDERGKLIPVRIVGDITLVR